MQRFIIPFYLYHVFTEPLAFLRFKLPGMCRIPVLFIFAIACIRANAQQTPATVAISTTGCTVQVYCFPGRFDAYDLEDGSTVFADDCEKERITYGIYCVKLKNPIQNLTAAQDTVITYLDFLKADYGIVKAAGYDKDHLLNSNTDTRGIFDTWQDIDHNTWKIKAWTNGNYICVMQMHSIKEMPEKKVTVFLDGLRFPGMKK